MSDNKIYKLNYSKSQPDSRDHILTFNTPLKVQPNVDLSNFCGPPKDQGDIGSCTAFAGAGLMELFYRKNMNKTVNDLYSEKFLYYATRVNVAKWPANEDSGAFLRDTMKAMVTYGVSLETTFPYLRPGETTCRYGDAPPPSAYTEALNNQVTKYATISNSSSSQLLSDLKNLLQNGYAFIAGINCYENIYNDVKGLIQLPQGQIIGGHAILFVGYDDSRQVLKFKNSWGGTWGDNGYGYLPYQYVLSNNLYDIWTIYAQEYENKSFEVVIPANRTQEFSNRMSLILTSLANQVPVATILQDIKTNPNNSKIFPSDVTELCNFVQNVSRLIAVSKTNSSRNRK